MIKYFIGGFFSKTLASFDDAVTRIPVIAKITKTRTERIAFAIGNLLAVTAVLIVAWAFSELLEQIPYANIISSVLILLLATTIYFDIFSSKMTTKVKIQEQKITNAISFSKFFKLILSGLIISFVTLVDDVTVIVPLYLGPPKTHIFVTLGVYASTIVQLIIMSYLAHKLAALKYLKEMAIVGLLILAVLVYLEVF